MSAFGPERFFDIMAQLFQNGHSQIMPFGPKKLIMLTAWFVYLLHMLRIKKQHIHGVTETLAGLDCLRIRG